MTRAEFLVALAKTPGPWQLREGVIEMTDAFRTCPVCAVAGQIGVYFWIAAEAIGLPHREAEIIASTADDMQGLDKSFDPQLRVQLLAATVERAAC